MDTRARTTRVLLTTSLLALGVGLGACSSESIADSLEKKVKEAAEKEIAKAEKRAADAPAEAAEAEPAPTMVSFDLASADPEWEGWSADGPEGAKVLKDGIKGARIASIRDHGFDVHFAPKKKDLAHYKESVMKGVEASEGKSKVTWTVDKSDHLEWTREGYGSTSYNFMMHMSVDGRDITCQNNVMMGIEGDDRLKMHKDACNSLKKG